eukprot:10165781-Alexandrium_andersonii.AAC.1
MDARAPTRPSKGLLQAVLVQIRRPLRAPSGPLGVPRIPLGNLLEPPGTHGTSSESPRSLSES